MPLFTPADIECLFQRVTQQAFELELVKEGDYRLDTEIFVQTIPKIRPTLTHEIVEEFRQDCLDYKRY